MKTIKFIGGPLGGQERPCPRGAVAWYRDGLGATIPRATGWETLYTPGGPAFGLYQLAGSGYDYEWVEAGLK